MRTPMLLGEDLSNLTEQFLCKNINEDEFQLSAPQLISLFKKNARLEVRRQMYDTELGAVVELVPVTMHYEELPAHDHFVGKIEIPTMEETVIDDSRMTCVPILGSKEFHSLVDLVMESADNYGSVAVEMRHDDSYTIRQVVYEDDKYNHMPPEEFVQLMNEYADAGIDFSPELHPGYNAHITLIPGRDGYLHVVSLEVGKPRSGYGSRVLEWTENYARKHGYLGVLVRSTTNTAANGLVVKRGYVPAYTTIEKRVEFGKLHGFRYAGNLEYDANNRLLGYWVKKF